MPNALKSAVAAMGVGTALPMPNSASLSSALGTMGAGTAGSMPNADLTLSAASQPASPQVIGEADVNVKLTVASYSSEANAVLYSDDVNRIRSALGTMGAGTATAAPNMTITGFAASEMAEAATSTKATPQVGMTAASKPASSKGQVIAGYGEMDRLDITITDALTLDVTLSDALILDVTIE